MAQSGKFRRALFAAVKRERFSAGRLIWKVFQRRCGSLAAVRFKIRRQPMHAEGCLSRERKRFKHFPFADAICDEAVPIKMPRIRRAFARTQSDAQMFSDGFMH